MKETTARPCATPLADRSLPHDPLPPDAPPDARVVADLSRLRQDLTGLVPELRAYARFLARDRHAADDLVQDTLVRALGALPRYQPTGPLRAWLFTIQRNVFYEQVRRRKTERSVLAQSVSPGEPAQGPHQDHEAEVADLQRLLWTLPALLREALVLVGAQGLSYEEAAAICAVPIGTMKARVSRARARVATAMAGAAESDAQDPPSLAHS